MLHVSKLNPTDGDNLSRPISAVDQLARYVLVCSTYYVPVCTNQPAREICIAHRKPLLKWLPAYDDVPTFLHEQNSDKIEFDRVLLMCVFTI